MILTHSFPASQPKDLLDALNRESRRTYSRMVVTHWRIYRKKGVWLSPSAATRLNDDQPGRPLYTRTVAMPLSRAFSRLARPRAVCAGLGLAISGFLTNVNSSARLFGRTPGLKYERVSCGSNEPGAWSRYGWSYPLTTSGYDH
jgi:hypothetical protein